MSLLDPADIQSCTMKSIVGLCVLIVLAGTAWAQTPEELARDLVSLRDGKYLYDEYSLCRIDARKIQAARRVGTLSPEPLEDVTFQLHTTAEASADGWISRDSFAAAIGAVSAHVRVGLFLRFRDVDVSKALGALGCKTLKEPIGTPDLEVKLFLTRDGMQIETTNAMEGKTVRQTIEWER
jgi:hypothetical protein